MRTYTITTTTTINHYRLNNNNTTNNHDNSYKNKNSKHDTATHPPPQTNTMPPFPPTPPPPPTPTTPTRWLLRLSLLATLAAIALLPRGVVVGHPDTNSSRQASDAATTEVAQTYCYQSVRTDSSDVDNKNNCFEVSSKGIFTRIFSSNSGEGDGQVKIKQGHVLPGLWDGHGHLLQYGEFLDSADLFGADSVDEVKRRLREYVGSHPGVGTKEVWGRGVGWDQMVLGGMPFAVSLFGCFFFLVDKGWFWLEDWRGGCSG